MAALRRVTASMMRPTTHTGVWLSTGWGLGGRGSGVAAAVGWPTQPKENRP